jgi:hypothetical protein
MAKVLHHDQALAQCCASIGVLAGRTLCCQPVHATPTPQHDQHHNTTTTNNGTMTTKPQPRSYGEAAVQLNMLPKLVAGSCEGTQFHSSCHPLPPPSQPTFFTTTKRGTTLCAFSWVEVARHAAAALPHPHSGCHCPDPVPPTEADTTSCPIHTKQSK